nr:hypothetical protein [Tanacetum cinerariifolium]
MATTIEQQVALDEALVPIIKRLRIGRSNFRLPSDIQSKESTLQVVYDVLCSCPFFKTITDVNINKLFQPWRSFGAVINKCLTGKSSGFDSFRTMTTTIEQQVALDEALVPSTKRLRIGRSNFRLPSDIQSKESTLQVVYDVLRQSPFFKAFLVTADVVSRHQTTQQYDAILPIELTTEDIRNTKAYKEYYACATGEAAPKPKAKGGGDDEETKSDGESEEEETTKKEEESFDPIPRTPKESEDDNNGEEDQGKDRDDDEGKKNNESDDVQDDDDDDNDEEEEIAKIDEPKDTESGGDDEETKSDGESEEEETTKKEEESFDPIPRTPEESENDGNGEEDQGLRISEEERMHEEEEADELYRDSSSTSSFVTNLLNPIIDPGMESIFMTGSSSVTPIPSPKSTMTPSIITTTTIASQPPIPPTLIPSDVLQTLPTFASVFRFEDRVKSLKVNFSKFMRTNQSKEAVSNIPGLVHQYMHQEMREAVREAVKSQVKAQVTRILPRIEESVNAQLEAKVLTRSSHSSRTSYAVADDLSEMELKKILIDKMEENKSIQEDVRMMMIRKDPPLDQTGGLRDEEKEGSMHQPALHLNQLLGVQAGAEDQPIVQTSQHPEWFSQPRKPPTPDRDWNKTLLTIQGNAQSWISALAKQTDARSSFNELLDTPIDFSNFIMNRLGIDTLTPELLLVQPMN